MTRRARVGSASGDKFRWSTGHMHIGMDGAWLTQATCTQHEQTWPITYDGAASSWCVMAQ